MEHLEGGGAQIWAGEVEPAGSFNAPFGRGAFALLLVTFTPVVADQMLRLARSFIDEGCRYAVCSGVECQEWETAFDDADMDANPTCDAERFVTTTSHPDEPLEAAAEFLFSCTAVHNAPPSRFVVATIGANAEAVAAVRNVVRSALTALHNSQGPCSG